MFKLSKLPSLVESSKLPNRRSKGIISFTASRIPLCLASWPSNSLAQALQQPHTAQPDSPEPQPQILKKKKKKKEFTEILLLFP